MNSMTQPNLNDFVSGTAKDANARASALLQRARFLQSMGATEENNYELAQISYQLKLMQNVRRPNNPVFQPAPIPVPSPTSTIKKQPVEGVQHSVFTPAQLAALKYQIMAFKLLSKDSPLPTHIQQARKPSKQSISSPLRSSIPTARTNYNAYVSPYNLIPKPISSYAHASRQQRLLIPSLLPSGLDANHIISERENRLKSHIQHHLQHHSPTDNIKDKIRIKSLLLLQKQQQLRQELVLGVSKSTVLATSVDRTAYRRMKKFSLREARHIEAAERQQRQNRYQSLRAAEQSRLSAICEHGANLVAYNKIKESKMTKLGRAVVQYHHHIEKEEQKRTERIAKERIQALKNDDEEAYLKLIDEAKDTRLTHLLKQTGQFLESLTKSVKDQQNESKSMASFGGTSVIQDEDEAEASASADYYQITHKVREEVCQPSIMVGGKLKDYQIKGLQWMVSLYNNNLNGILADEMGLGKTIQTISLITYLIEMKRQNGPFLIIVPLSTLTNWTLEFDKWAPSIRKIVYKGPPHVRRDLASVVKGGGYHVLLTTFEYIIRDKNVLSRVKWLYLIMDEGHRMKNANSKLTVSLRQHYYTRYRLILTGTPLQNNLPELWALLNFILPKIFKSVKSFEEWFNTPFSNQGVQDKVDLNEEEQLLIIKRLHKVLRPFLLRRLKSDVEAELPDKVERIIKCKLSSLQLKIYHQLKRNCDIYTNNGQNALIPVRGLNNTLMQLRKVCNHPFAFEGVENTLNPSGKSNELLYRCSGKFELLDRMLAKLKRTGHRVLIFFQMTRIMSIMEDYLNWRNYRYLRLDGSTKSEERSALLHQFNQPNSPYFVFLLSTRAGGLGLNLQTADTVIIFDSDWNPHQDLQAQDRAHRIGQTKEVRIFRLITSNSIEENILARAQYKLDIDGKVIQAGKFDNRSTEEDREAFLRNLLEDKIDGGNDDELDEEADDEELNEMLKRSDEDMVIFKKIDLERERAETDMYARRGYKKRLERLIQEDELPDILTQDQTMAVNEDSILEFGRGRRAKEEVRYDDGLTEEEWLEALEREEEEEATKSRSKRRQNQASEQGEQGRKRGGDKKTSETGRKRNKVEQVDRVPPLIRQQLTRVFEACYKAVEEAVEEDEESYRPRCELFMDLVSKKEYPLYYTLIKNPISMNMIKERIHSSYYETVAEFESDFHLMFENARTFNEEGSVVYEDANEMQKIFDQELERQCPGGALPNLYHQRAMNENIFTNYAPQETSLPSRYKNKPASNRKKRSRTRNIMDDEEDDPYEEDDDDEEYYE
ncbi:SNF2 family N-terminal domain-containing protein [Gilbertella persicaria]|uniref:SNF2 family N-terminal domain-containing protein n=1 Tax=Gilbertella persicaria TaxID=101096 RepID=UPI002220D261|nr:SNF2 family N-terminal domain-containing protein [Gilbertella persicaria]KAI8065336.1 SNF2 family N-terminal domain-containing protein [Gilbertella persicaria]